MIYFTLKSNYDGQKTGKRKIRNRKRRKQTKTKLCISKEYEDKDWFCFHFKCFGRIDFSCGHDQLVHITPRLFWKH